MYPGSGNEDLLSTARIWSIMNWGVAGAIMVGLPASFVVDDEDRLPNFLTAGFVSLLIVRTFLVWREYRDAKEGF